MKETNKTEVDFRDQNNSARFVGWSNSLIKLL